MERIKNGAANETSNKPSLLDLILVLVVVNIFIYVFVVLFHNLLAFQKHNFANADHYLLDPRFDGKRFDFLRAFNQFDAQWYIKIAEKGYGPTLQRPYSANTKRMDLLSYAFFPLYPAILSLLNVFLKNTELTAFIFSNLLLFGDFILLYLFVKKWYGKSIAERTALLLFVFPLSIFYRSYFTEGIFLFLLLVFSYFFIEKKYLYSSLFLSLLIITKGNSFLLAIVFIFFLWRDKKVSLLHKVISVVVLFIPLAFWTLFCFLKTGDPLFFITVRQAWFYLPKSIPFLLRFFIYPAVTVVKMLNFPALTLHSFHNSKIDMLCILLVVFTLLKWSILKSKHKAIFVALFFNVIFFTDSMSFGRYLSIMYPAFIIISSKLNKTAFLVVFSFSFIALLFVSLLFVNWYWIG